MGARSYSRSKFFKRLVLGDGIDIEFMGNWDNVLNYLRKLPMPVMMAAQQGQALVAKEFAKEVQNSILMGKVNGPQKKHKNHDERLLIDTKLYVDSIRAYREGKIWKVGIQPGYMTNHKSGGNIELRFLAQIHEFGNATRHIPARPVWFPTYQRLGGIHFGRKKVYDLMKKAVKKNKPKEVKISYAELF